MRGRLAIQGIAGAQWNSELDVSVKHLARENVDGLDCEIVQIDQFNISSQRTLTGCRLWLCPSRCYLPLKAEHFPYWVSSKTAVAKCHLDRIFEVEHLVWFPEVWWEEAYDKQLIEQASTLKPIL